MNRFVIATLGLIFTVVSAQAQKPALTQNVDEKGRVPYQRSVDVGCSNSPSCVVDFDAVPAGHRLVVLDVTVSFSTGLAVNAGEVTLRGASADPSGAFPGIHIPFTPFNGGYAVNAAVTYYMEAGDTPKLRIVPDVNGGGNVEATITGYLVTLT